MPELPELQIEADLRLNVTASTGESTSGRISGAGNAIRVDVDRPDILFSAVNYADVGGVADLLTDSGISVIGRCGNFKMPDNAGVVPTSNNW